MHFWKRSRVLKLPSALVLVYISENQGQHKSQILYVYKITTDLQKYTLYTRKKSIYSIYQFIYLKFKHLNATVPL